MKKKSPKVLSTLIENDRIFECSGFSTIKITKGGESNLVRLPIKSTGVAEYQQTLSDKAPRPPAIREVVKASSTEGKALGLTKDSPVMVFDTTDETYIDALERHTNEFSWKVAVYALDIEWKKADGSPAETYEEKKNILQSAGITGQQLEKIFSDVGALSTYAEEREDFLSES